MKTRYLFSLAALALMTAGCTSDENWQDPSGENGRVIPFSAVISTVEDATRGLSQAADGKTITTTWAENEQVALIHNGVVDVMTISSIDKKTQEATITGDLTGTPASKDEVTVVYPASLVDKETKAIKADLLAEQDGLLSTIAEEMDCRVGSSKLEVSEAGATFSAPAEIALQNAIWRLSLTTDDGYKSLKAEQFVVKNGSGDILTTVTPLTPLSEFFVVMAPAANAAYSFEATVGDEKYVFAKSGLTFKAGKYYHSKMAMQIVVPPTVPVESVTLDKDKGEIAVDKTLTLEATVNPPDASYKTVTWASSDTRIATVTVGADGKATVTGVAGGTVTITVTATNGTDENGDDKTATCTVTVKKIAGSISYSDEEVIAKNTEATITNELTMTGDGTVTYESSNEDVATVDENGEVTIVGVGETIIKATVADGAKYTYNPNWASYKLIVSGEPSTIDRKPYENGDNPF